jgi:hypothetical protein
LYRAELQAPNRLLIDSTMYRKLGLGHPEDRTHCLDPIGDRQVTTVDRFIEVSAEGVDLLARASAVAYGFPVTFKLQ